jgi:hypothetical protein
VVRLASPDPLPRFTAFHCALVETSMRYTLILGLFAILVLVPGSAFPVAERATDDKNQLFNGKDFTGWEGLTDQFWSIKKIGDKGDVAIVGSTYPKGNNFNTFLCTKKKYRDFELSFQVKLTGKTWGGNSGVQIRSKIHDMKRFAVTGPQADMGDIYWGSLYGENFGGMMKAADKDQVSKFLKKDDYQDYAIKCVGKHVTITVNGVKTVDDDFEKMPEEGIIALQLHGGPPMEVVFKNFKFKELKGDK